MYSYQHTSTHTPLHTHLYTPTQAEQEEKERLRKERAEAHKYTYVRVATDDDLAAQIGSTRQFDLVDHDKVCAPILWARAAHFNPLSCQAACCVHFQPPSTILPSTSLPPLPTLPLTKGATGSIT